MVSRHYDDSELSSGIRYIHQSNYSEQSTSILLSEQLHNGNSIILSVRAKNGAGLVTKWSKLTVLVIWSDHKEHHGFLEIQRHSCDVHYCNNDCTCAIIGKPCDPHKVPEPCVSLTEKTNVYQYPEIEIHLHVRKDENRYYTPSTACLSAEWRFNDSDAFRNISRFEWSIGLRDHEPGAGIFNLRTERVWHSTGKEQNITHCLPPGKSLSEGEEYVVYVRVWYSFSEYKQFVSLPVMIDSTPPHVRRGRTVKDSDETCVADFDFVTRSSLVTACWGNVFQDSQSGIQSYTIQVGSSRYGSDIMKPLDVGMTTNYSISQNLFKAGTKYYITVKATNKAGVYGVAFSDGFVVDDEAPVTGVVFNTAEHVNLAAQSSLSSFGVSWRGFQDHHSAIASYQGAVYKTTEYLSNVTYYSVGYQNRVVLNGLSLDHGEWYQASVRAIDSAGHISKEVSPPILVDSTAPIGFTCSNFSDITANISWNYEEQSNHTVETSIKGSVGVQKNIYFKIRVSKTFQTEYFFSEMNIFFKIGEEFVPKQFLLIYNGTRIEAHHYFTALKSGTLDIEVLTEQVGFISETDVSVFQCEEIQQTPGPTAVTVLQIMPSLVSVSARVSDPESDLLQIKIGAGTTRGGFQIQPLTSTFLHFHELIETDVPHGIPVFVSVIAENSAGLVSVFQADPIIIDHTPPSITKSELTLVYASDRDHNTTVIAELSWTVYDKESGVKSCWCALGHKPLSTNIQPWTLATRRVRCRLEVVDAYHHQEVFGSVKCFNQIELHSSMSAGPRTVLLLPPSSREGQVVFLVSNETPDISARPPAQCDTMHLQMSWVSLGDDHNVKTFRYRLTAGGVPVTEWRNTSQNYAEVDVDLRDGDTCTAEVVAVDTREQHSEVIRGSLVVDGRPPVLTGSDIYTQWDEKAVYFNWKDVFHHPRSDLVYNIAVGSERGYTELLYKMDQVVANIVIDIDSSVTSVYVVIKATADNGQFVVYETYKSRK